MGIVGDPFLIWIKSIQKPQIWEYRFGDDCGLATPTVVSGLVAFTAGVKLTHSQLIFPSSPRHTCQILLRPSCQIWKKHGEERGRRFESSFWFTKYWVLIISTILSNTTVCHYAGLHFKMKVGFPRRFRKRSSVCACAWDVAETEARSSSVSGRIASIQCETKILKKHRFHPISKDFNFTNPNQSNIETAPLHPDPCRFLGLVTYQPQGQTDWRTSFLIFLRLPKDIHFSQAQHWTQHLSIHIPSSGPNPNRSIAIFGLRNKSVDRTDRTTELSEIQKLSGHGDIQGIPEVLLVLFILYCPLPRLDVHVFV